MGNFLDLDVLKPFKIKEVVKGGLYQVTIGPLAVKIFDFDDKHDFSFMVVIEDTELKIEVERARVVPSNSLFMRRWLAQAPFREENKVRELVYKIEHAYNRAHTIKGNLVIPTMKEILEMESAESSHIIKHIIGQGDVITIAGNSGAGKSLLIQEMAYSIATGLPWLGHFEVNPMFKGKSILWFDIEMGMTTLKKRLHQVEPIMGKDVQGLIHAVYWSPEWGPVFSPSNMERLMEAITRYNAILALFDNYTAVLVRSGGRDINQNDPVQVRKYVGTPAKDISDAMSIGIVMVDHFNKGGGTFTGSQGKIDACDSAYFFNRTAGTENSNDFVFAKIRDLDSPYKKEDKITCIYSFKTKKIMTQEALSQMSPKDRVKWGFDSSGSEIVAKATATSTRSTEELHKAQEYLKEHPDANNTDLARVIGTTNIKKVKRWRDSGLLPGGNK